jgi:glycosyltransferase involved in cell wall biosynthesis
LSCALVRIGAPVAGLLMNPNLPAPPARLFPELAAQSTLTWATASEVRRLQADGPTVCLLPSPMEGSQPVDGVWPPFLATTPFVPLIHDAIPYADAVAYDIRHADRRLHTSRPLFLESAAHVLATTRFAAWQWSTLVTPVGDDITPVGMGVSPFYRPADDRAVAMVALQHEVPAISKPFVLYVGGDDERKNVDGALRAWGAIAASLRTEYQFVVACSADATVRAKWTTIATAAGLADGEYVLTGFVTNETLRLLYQTARLHFFVSHSEGFGMPIVEGIACGCPAISSNTTSMPEVVGWAPGLFDPTDIAAMAALVTRALTDARYYAELAAACDAALPQHSWEAAARRVLQALADHVPTPTRSGTWPYRVAIVCSSGTAVDAALGEAIRASPRAEIDVFGGRPNDADPWAQLPGAVIRYPLQAFDRTMSAAGYDDVIHLSQPDSTTTAVG